MGIGSMLGKGAAKTGSAAVHGAEVAGQVATTTAATGAMKANTMMQPGIGTTQQGLNPLKALGGVMQGQMATNMSDAVSSAQMGQIEQTAAMTMEQQTKMAQIQMMIKMSEALAKMFKSLGECIKNLA